MLFFLTEIGGKLKKMALLVFTVFFMASLIPAHSYVFESSPQKIIIDLLLLSENRIPEDAYFVSSNNALIRSTVQKSGASFLVFEKQNEYFKDKDVFLLKDIWWWILDECEIREFVYKNYDLEPIETGAYKTHGKIYEVGVYRLIKK